MTRSVIKLIDASFRTPGRLGAGPAAVGCATEPARKRVICQEQNNIFQEKNSGTCAAYAARDCALRCAISKLRRELAAT